MKLNHEQYEKIAKYLPRQRGNVSMSNLELVNAILYVTENGCKWRALPESYGNWHTVYVRMNRWSKNGVLQRLFEGLQQENIIRIRMEAVCLDSSASEWNWGFKKSGKQGIGRSRGGLTTKIHMVTASDRAAVSFSLSAGNSGDGPEGRRLLNFTAANEAHRYLIMDRAYEGDETRALAVELGYIPVVPPKQNRKDPWEYDKNIYRRRNEVERFFLRLKRFRKIFTRYDKLDIMFAGFILFAMTIDSIV